jgi:hypothetical protein
MCIHHTHSSNLVTEPRSNLFFHNPTTMLTSTISALTSSSTGTISSSSTVIPVPSLGNAITVRLSRDNFFPWKAQAAPVLHAHQLFGYVDGSISTLPQEITQGSGDAAREVPNPDYPHWYTQDQLLLSALVASMGDDMLGQMTQYTTAQAV